MEVHCKNQGCVLQAERVDKTLRKYTSFDEAKADEYRYWQSRPAHERMDAVSELSLAMCRLKGSVQARPNLKELPSALNAERVKF
jgi:hypothetical protein